MDSVPDPVHRESGAWAAAALAGLLLFAATCVAVQVVRPELDWVRVPLSFYLIGRYGWVLRAAYFVLAASLVLLGMAGYRGLSEPARSGAPLVLFVCGAAGLAVTALATTDTWTHPATLHGFVHGVAAQTAFLCTSVAMLLQSARMRREARWRTRASRALAWAALCFAGLWIQLLWRNLPRGLSQKVLVAMMLGWLFWSAWMLSRDYFEKNYSTN